MIDQLATAEALVVEELPEAATLELILAAEPTRRMLGPAIGLVRERVRRFRRNIVQRFASPVIDAGAAQFLVIGCDIRVAMFVRVAVPA